MKTLYLWDLADTIFLEKWDKHKSGCDDYLAYLKKSGWNLKTISPIDFELSYKIPYLKALLKVRLNNGAEKILKFAKHNVAFTTGNKEQMAWRDTQLKQKGQIGTRKFFQKIISAFDFGNTSKKTTE